MEVDGTSRHGSSKMFFRPIDVVGADNEDDVHLFCVVNLLFRESVHHVGNGALQVIIIGNRVALPDVVIGQHVVASNVYPNVNNVSIKSIQR